MSAAIPGSSAAGAAAPDHGLADEQDTIRSPEEFFSPEGPVDGDVQEASDSEDDEGSEKAPTAEAFQKEYSKVKANLLVAINKFLTVGSTKAKALRGHLPHGNCMLPEVFAVLVSPTGQVHKVRSSMFTSDNSAELIDRFIEHTDVLYNLVRTINDKDNVREHPGVVLSDNQLFKQCLLTREKACKAPIIEELTKGGLSPADAEKKAQEIFNKHKPNVKCTPSRCDACRRACELLKWHPDVPYAYPSSLSKELQKTLVDHYKGLYPNDFTNALPRAGTVNGVTCLKGHPPGAPPSSLEAATQEAPASSQPGPSTMNPGANDMAISARPQQHQTFGKVPAGQVPKVVPAPAPPGSHQRSVEREVQHYEEQRNELPRIVAQCVGDPISDDARPAKAQGVVGVGGSGDPAAGLGATAEEQPVKKAGRPKKAENPVAADEVVAEPRKRGRPRKNADDAQCAAGPLETPDLTGVADQAASEDPEDAQQDGKRRRTGNTRYVDMVPL